MTEISNHTSNPEGPLARALLKEHHEIDAGIETFTSRATESLTGEPKTGRELSAWSEPLVAAMHALRRHIYLEETLVFPKLRVGGLMMAVMVMIREHGELWREMDAVEQQLSEMAAPQRTEVSQLISSCRNMLALLDAHNMKEEPVIYPHLDTDLDGPTERLLTEFLKTGEMPEGWVCEAARSTQ